MKQTDSDQYRHCFEDYPHSIPVLFPKSLLKYIHYKHIPIEQSCVNEVTRMLLTHSPPPPFPAFSARLLVVVGSISINCFVVIGNFVLGKVSTVLCACESRKEDLGAE